MSYEKFIKKYSLKISIIFVIRTDFVLEIAIFVVFGST